MADQIEEIMQIGGKKRKIRKEKKGQKGNKEKKERNWRGRGKEKQRRRGQNILKIIE